MGLHAARHTARTSEVTGIVMMTTVVCLCQPGLGKEAATLGPRTEKYDEYSMVSNTEGPQVALGLPKTALVLYISHSQLIKLHFARVSFDGKTLECTICRQFQVQNKIIVGLVHGRDTNS